MEDIEIGEYVRTKDGYLGKLIAINKQDYNYLVVDISKNIRNDEYPATYLYLKNENIAKHSKNIIDLIENGDYLNGYLLRKINGELCNFDLNEMEWTPLKNIDIFESLVTHEQFESIEYKI